MAYFRYLLAMVIGINGWRILLENEWDQDHLILGAKSGVVGPLITTAPTVSFVRLKGLKCYVTIDNAYLLLIRWSVEVEKLPFGWFSFLLKNVYIYRLTHAKNEDLVDPQR